MKFLAKLRLGDKQSLTPEGFLLCADVPVARTGEQIYGPDETPIPPGPDGLVHVVREADEIFRAEFVASLNGKPACDEHPDEEVQPQNWRNYVIGVGLNPHRGEGDQSDLLLMDLLIYDEQAIKDIRGGKREISLGYNADYDEDDERPGWGRQYNLIGNHIALVDSGRCGSRCAIGDQLMVPTRDAFSIRTFDEKPVTVVNKKVYPKFDAWWSDLTAKVMKAAASKDEAEVKKILEEKKPKAEDSVSEHEEELESQIKDCVSAGDSRDEALQKIRNGYGDAWSTEMSATAQRLLDKYFTHDAFDLKTDVRTGDDTTEYKGYQILENRGVYSVLVRGLKYKFNLLSEAKDYIDNLVKSDEFTKKHTTMYKGFLIKESLLTGDFGVNEGYSGKSYGRFGSLAEAKAYIDKLTKSGHDHKAKIKSWYDSLSSRIMKAVKSKDAEAEVQKLLSEEKPVTKDDSTLNYKGYQIISELNSAGLEVFVVYKDIGGKPYDNFDTLIEAKTYIDRLTLQGFGLPKSNHDHKAKIGDGRFNEWTKAYKGIFITLVKFDNKADVYYVHRDADGGTNIGEFNTLAEAKAYIDKFTKSGHDHKAKIKSWYDSLSRRIMKAVKSKDAEAEVEKLLKEGMPSAEDVEYLTSTVKYKGYQIVEAIYSRPGKTVFFLYRDIGGKLYKYGEFDSIIKAKLYIDDRLAL